MYGSTVNQNGIILTGLSGTFSGGLAKGSSISQSKKGLSVRWCLCTIEDEDRKRLRQVSL